MLPGVGASDSVVMAELLHYICYCVALRKDLTEHILLSVETEQHSYKHLNNFLKCYEKCENNVNLIYRCLLCETNL